MPTYEYICENMHEFDRVLPMARANDPQVCDCGASALKLLSAPMVRVKEIRYESPIDGRPITTYQEHLNDLARNDCVPYEPGIRQDQDRKAKEREEALERSVDQTVEREIALMPAQKRERLEAELQAGFAAEPVRGSAPLKSIVTPLETT